jgi:hypothetical protein
VYCLQNQGFRRIVAWPVLSILKEECFLKNSNKFHNESLIGLCYILLESLYVILVRKC